MKKKYFEFSAIFRLPALAQIYVFFFHKNIHTMTYMSEELYYIDMFLQFLFCGVFIET